MNIFNKLFIFSALMAITASADTVNVSIQSSAFSPENVEINSGDVVKWTNFDSFSHISINTGMAETWDSGNLGNNAVYSKVFSIDGTHAYKCGIHAFMTGTVVVSSTSVEEKPTGKGFSVQSSPNPFNPSTEIRFHLPTAGPVSIQIFDIKGNTMLSVSHTFPGGWNSYTWLAKTGKGMAQMHGKLLPAGKYFLKVSYKNIVRDLSLVLSK